MTTLSLQDLRMLLPEAVLAAGVLALFIGDIFVRGLGAKRRYLTLLALVVLGATLTALLDLAAGFASGRLAPSGAFFNQVAIDPVGVVFKLLFLGITAVAVITSLLSKELPDKNLGEYFGLLLSITLGMFLMASANDLLMVYLGLELVSIVSFALAGYRLHNRKSSEAALKYVIYGGAASGVMLFGISLIYGLFGTTELTTINAAITQWTAGRELQSGLASGILAASKFFPLTVLVSLIFIFVGIGYKIAVVPFHMWAPDVYEGAPTPFTGFLSVGPKAAGFALLMRFFVGAFVPAASPSGFAADAQGLFELSIDLPLPAMIGVIAAVTMTLGNLAAIPQNNIKRMLAYSSIAHAGYLLMGFVVLSETALQSVVFYLVIYFLMNIGAFAVVQAVRDRAGGESMHDFNGLGSREPVLAMAMVIFLLSLAGLPPFAGFVAKFWIFFAVIQRGGFWYWVLALIGVANSAVSLYYYMRVARAMYLTEPAGEPPPRARRSYVGLTAALAVPVLVLGIYWSPLLTSISSSISFYRSPQNPPVAAAVAPADAKDPAGPVPSFGARGGADSAGVARAP